MFKADSTFIKKAVELCKMETDTSPVFNPTHGPEWYNPDLSSDFVKFSKSSTGRGSSLAYDQINGIAYYCEGSY
jgi:hypothetical protein